MQEHDYNIMDVETYDHIDNDSDDGSNDSSDDDSDDEYAKYAHDPDLDYILNDDIDTYNLAEYNCYDSDDD